MIGRQPCPWLTRRGFAAARFAVCLAASIGLTWPSGAAAQAVSPPSIPDHGAYLGAWVNPTGRAEGRVNGQAEINQLPLFQAQIGRPMAILHLFIPFNYDDANEPLLLTVLDEIEGSGATPMIDLQCVSVDAINSGTEDGTFRTLAATLAKFRKPVFLRWFWEMNRPTPKCVSRDYLHRYANFISAWRRLFQILRTAGPPASNVAMVWCPAAHTPDRDLYYPGDPYVDWIGADAFYRSHNNSPLDSLFGDWYAHYYTVPLSEGRKPKPLLVGSTGAIPRDQPNYLQSIQQLLPGVYPGIKAVLYFDAPGQHTVSGQTLVLVGGGVAAFRSLAATPYFSYVDTNADAPPRR